MSERMLHYVCDRCGNYWHTSNATGCPACGHAAIWEFPRGRDALLHATHVKRVAKSGLFCEAKR